MYFFIYFQSWFHHLFEIDINLPSANYVTTETQLLN